MSVERGIRAIAGIFILLSLGLARWVDPAFLWFTAFVGANLLQSAVTGFCPMAYVLRALGWKSEAASSRFSPGG